MSDTLKEIVQWFEIAKPEPSIDDLCTQIGCHYEEVAEMAIAISNPKDTEFSRVVSLTADFFKNAPIPKGLTADDIVDNRLELLDALCDQIVTATGVAYMMGFDIDGALKEVIRSNNSKMVDGKFEFDANGKIMKPSSFSEPDLTPFVK